MPFRNAFPKYTNIDVAQTTDLMDLSNELELLGIYCEWVVANIRHVADHTALEFLTDLSEDVVMDHLELEDKTTAVLIQSVTG